MAMTVEEARELRATLVEAFNPLHGARLGNVTWQDAGLATLDVLNRMDVALAAVEHASGAQDPAQARLETMTEAVRVLCHDLRDGAQVLLVNSQLARRYAERGDFDRALAKNRALEGLVRERVAAIQEGEARALGVGQDGDPAGEG